MRPSDETLALGDRAARALLGVDVLYRDESADPTGLVVLNMDRGQRCPPEPFGDYVGAEACWRELRADASSLPEADRRLYYDQLCASTLAFIAWRRGALPFERQLEGFLHAPARPVPEAELEALRSELAVRLQSMGYRGDLEARVEAWEDRHRVEPPDVASTLRSLLDEAWDRTEARFGTMPGPRSDGMKVAKVSGVAYNARCDYTARTIQINTDPVLTRPGLKHLAAHEGYPGHWLQFKLRETMAEDGRAPSDVLLSVVNTASSSVFEGIADHGLRLVDWIESDDDRVQSTLTRYRAALGTGAAWRLHALGRGLEETAAWLRERALSGGPGWVANRLAFVAAPERAVLIWSYWLGEPAVTGAFERLSPGDEPAFLDYLYGRMHSTRTVAMFDRAQGA